MLGWDVKIYPEGEPRNVIIYWSNLSIGGLNFLDLSNRNSNNIISSSGYPIKVKCTYGDLRSIIPHWFANHSKGFASYETIERAELSKLTDSSLVIVEAWDLS